MSFLANFCVGVAVDFAFVTVPVMTMLWSTLTGAIVVVPFWIAEIRQVPVVSRLREFPVTEQIVGVEERKVTT